jgi:hypothetical protein
MTFPLKETIEGVKEGNTIDDIAIGKIAEGVEVRSQGGT